MANASDRPTVLVVEDEILIRMGIVDSLVDAGFSVLEAGNAAQAIKVLEAHSEIAFLFTDIDMPGTMDGLKLAAAVRDRWPPIKIVITSGHVKMRAEDLPVDGEFVVKPYDCIQVVQTLWNLAHAV